MKRKDIYLIIAMISPGIWNAKFGMCLLGLNSYLSRHKVPSAAKFTWRNWSKKGSMVGPMREQIILDALAKDATHLLFIDTDQTFPRDIVHRMLKHRKPVLACNVPTKEIPAKTNTFIKDLATGGAKLIPSPPGAEGLQEVWMTGTGVMMIDLQAIRDAELTHPFFYQRWDEENQRYLGEDTGFCQKLHDAGLGIWIDHTLSKEIGHMGELEYRHDLVVMGEERAVG